MVQLGGVARKERECARPRARRGDVVAVAARRAGAGFAAEQPHGARGLRAAPVVFGHSRDPFRPAPRDAGHDAPRRALPPVDHAVSAVR